MNTTRTIALIISLAILSTLTGCAKFPAGPTKTGKQLVLTLRVRDRIDVSDPSMPRHYFIAIDNDGDPNTGPWAVVTPPWGNGWGTSQHADKSIGITSYLQYDANNQECYLYGMVPGTSFTQHTSPQPPIRSELLDGGQTLRVVIDFSQIATAAIPADQIRQLNVNFITTSALPLAGQAGLGRIWDGLGPSGQNFMDINTTIDQLYPSDNANGPGVSDPGLDIIYCSVEVQTVSSR